MSAPEIHLEEESATERAVGQVIVPGEAILSHLEDKDASQASAEGVALPGEFRVAP